jgi:hypothetical protein
LTVIVLRLELAGKFSAPGHNFLASAQDCWLGVVEDKTILVGQLVDRDGNVVQNEIGLDDYLDNVDGAFEWSG